MASLVLQKTHIVVEFTLANQEGAGSFPVIHFVFLLSFLAHFFAFLHLLKACRAIKVITEKYGAKDKYLFCSTACHSQVLEAFDEFD